MKPSMETQKITLSQIKSQLLQIFIEEFNDCIHDILNISQSEFKFQFIHRINIILLSYYRNLIPTIRNYQEIFNEAYRTINEDYYMPALYDCQKAMSNPVREKLKQFHPHCKANNFPHHACQGVFFLVRNPITKDAKYVICTNCKSIYNVNFILMFCQSCDTDFFSFYDESENEQYPPATWDEYHCGLIVNQQMNCIKCKSLLWLKGKRLYCKKCNKKFLPQEIDWICIMCKKKFKSGAKVYNPIEYKGMKISVKRAIIDKMLIKPTVLPCRCDLEPLKLNFRHSIKCNGVLYEGDFLRKKIVVCSECQNFSLVSKFNWLCPLCKKSFKSNYTRTFPSKSENYKDEFTIQNDETLLSISTNYTNSREIQVNNFYTPHKTKIRLRNEIQGNFQYYTLTSNREMRPQLTLNEKNTQNKIVYKKKITSKAKSNISIKLTEDDNMENQKTDKLYILSLKKIRQNGPHHIRLNSDPNTVENKFKVEKGFISFSLDKKVYRKTSVGYLTLDRKSQNSTIKVNRYKKVLVSSTQLKNSKINSFIQDNRNDLFFNVEDYNVIAQLEQGTNGRLYLVQDKDKKIFCMKKEILNDSKKIESIRNEYEIFSKYQHINILKIHGFSEKKFDLTTYAFYILMEVGKNDWEKEIIEKQTKGTFYSERELINIVKQLTKALSYLQRNKVAHRDVKVQNILVFERGVYKIANFEEAVKYMDEINLLNQICGTELYMSPLLYDGVQSKAIEIEHNVFKSDVFSLGMCLLYAVTLNLKILCRVREYKDEKKYNNFLVSVIKVKYSNSFSELLTRMLSLYEWERPDFIELEEILENL